MAYPHPSNGAQTNGNGPRGIVPFSAKADRSPPQNIDAEKAVLCAILLDKNFGGGDSAFAKAANLLKPDDFFREAHSAIFRAMMIVHGSGKPVDLFTVIDELERQNRFNFVGGDDYLEEILNTIGHAESVEHHADIVKQKAETRRGVEVASQVIDRAYSNQYTSRQIIDFAAKGFEDIAAAGGGDEEQLDVRDYPEPPGPEAYHGPIGEMVKRIAAHSEASPPAILVQMLTAFGSIVGRAPHFVHESNEHHCNLYACVVGNSAIGAKGTSWGYVRHAGPEIDETWRERIITGVNSGEMLIELVGDDRLMPGGGVVEGVADKRMLLLETEFARLLSVFTRQGDSLSVQFRNGWDTGELATRSRANNVSATGAHISVVAHVTPEELNARLTLVEVANGLGNRFIWVWSVKTQDRPEAGRFRWKTVEPMIGDLAHALAHVRASEKSYRDLAMTRTETADELWRSVLPSLSEPRPGLLGKMLARGKPYVMRMAMIFAIADMRFRIDVPHLMAALEIWDYSVRSVDYIFGDRLGDKDASKLLDALKLAGDEGITQTDVRRKVFSGRVSAEKLGDLLNRMVQAGLIHKTVDATKSKKPVTVWRRGANTPPAHLLHLRTSSEEGGEDRNETHKPPF